MYINSVLPSVFYSLLLRRSLSNHPFSYVGLIKFSSLPFQDLRDSTPNSLRIATLELASNNLICSVALTGVLALQAGRSWAERAEEGDSDDEFVIVESDGSSEVEASVSVLPNNGVTLKRRRSRGKTPEIELSEEKVKPLLQARVQTS